MNPRPPLPPFTEETARQKVQAAEDAWNSRDPERVSLAYTPDTEWRNRDVFLNGRAEVVEFLRRKWQREHDYRLKKTLWAFTGNRIAVRFEYEFHDDAGQWFRAYRTVLHRTGADFHRSIPSPSQAHERGQPRPRFSSLGFARTKLFTLFVFPFDRHRAACFNVHMDALSDLMRVLRFTSGVFLDATMRKPWCIRAQLTQNDCGPDVDASGGIVAFHYLLDGELKLRLDKETPRVCHPGDLILLSRNDPHWLGTDLNLPPLQAAREIRRADESEMPYLHFGNGPKVVNRFVCGFLATGVCGHPLLEALPPLLVASARSERAQTRERRVGGKLLPLRRPRTCRAPPRFTGHACPAF